MTLDLYGHLFADALDAAARAAAGGYPLRTEADAANLGIVRAGR